MSLDFTFDKFSRLCEIAIENYPIITFSNYLTQKLPEKFVIMRHDIDRKPKNAIIAARIENRLGISSTYYFRNNIRILNPEIICEIENLGHEIGYHYEVLGKAKGDHKKAIKLFEYELNEFRKICDIKTIGMHGNPLSIYDERRLWNIYDFKNFGILGESYLSAGNDLNYFSDTGRGWNFKNNYRDFIPKNKKNENVNTTDDIIKLIKNKEIDKFYILSHPERWSSNNLEWTLNYTKDCLFNIVKKVIIASR